MKKLLIISVLCLILSSCVPGALPTSQAPQNSNPPLAAPTLQVETPTPNPLPTNPPQAQPKAGLPNFDHIVLIMLENRDFSSVIGSKSMPLLNELATKNVLLSDYFSVAHPSLPNYLALMSGSTQGVTTDCTNCFVNQPNLADEIEASNRTWKAYMEDLPTPCFVGNSGTYAQKHDPLLYFDSIRLNPARCDRSILPLTSLDNDLANNQLPNFSFIEPNLCNSGHSCAAGVADKWAGAMVAKLQASPALGNNSLIIIAFDEGSDKSTQGCCGVPSPAGGKVAAVLISPSATPAFNDQTPYSHYSLLKTILTAWNLPPLGQTAKSSTVAIEAPWSGQLSQAAPTPSSGPVSVQDGIGSFVAGQMSSCGNSSPASGSYSIQVCLNDPTNGSKLSGNVTVDATVHTTGSAMGGVQDMIFFLDGKYLLTSFSSPYTFSLPTGNWLDGTHTLAVRAQMHDKSLTNPGGITVSFNNGVGSPSENSQTFQPTTGRPAASGSAFTVAATGDGAGGEPNGAAVTNLIATLNPNLFLYLGDVYANGSSTEFYNWYGSDTTYFGRFRAITDPTVGNHEYLTPGASGYFNYWNNIPPYYSFNAGGWHFISLDSNSSFVPVGVGSPQYQWLQQDLAANSQTCTIAYYHHPLFTIGTEKPSPAISDIWALLAQNGVSIVLNGHDHDYQHWVALDGNGQPSPNGITEFVVGSGGHGLQNFTKTDNRVAASDNLNPTAFGVLLLQLSQNGATFSYHSASNGSILDSGFIPCTHATP